jgi:mRNA interferase MazF
MVNADFIPDRGDLVWISFMPQAGHEQSGRRPALVLSPRAYNSKTSLCLACPITSQIKGYPFEVSVPAGKKIEGVILADQVRSLDWSARQAEFAENIPAATVDEVIRKIKLILE